MVHPHNGILFNYEKEWCNDLCYNMGETSKKKTRKKHWHNQQSEKASYGIKENILKLYVSDKELVSRTHK